MKIINLLFTVFILLLCSSSYAQKNSFKIGIKGGFSKYDFGIGSIKIDQLGDYDLGLADEKFGFHGGVTIQLKFNNFFIQPEALINTSKVDFSLKSKTIQLVDSIYTESYKDLDIPLMFGFKKGALRINAGPVGHLHLSSSSELFQIATYTQKFSGMMFGWQAGIGLDFWKFTFDLRYEGNFEKFGNHITFNNTSYNFSNSPTRLICSVGLQF